MIEHDILYIQNMSKFLLSNRFVRQANTHIPVTLAKLAYQLVNTVLLLEFTKSPKVPNQTSKNHQFSMPSSAVHTPRLPTN
jgi:hypothetical protein